MKKASITLVLLISSILYSFGQNENKVNNINNGMPNRISMNVTVPKQTQGATFGEKVNAGLHASGSYVIFPNKQAFLINASTKKVSEMTSSEVAKVNQGLHAAGSALSQGASLVGGALPGGAIISAAISKPNTGRPIWEVKDSGNEIKLPEGLSDGEYELTVVMRSGQKDTMKTQVKFGILVEGGTYKVVSART
jgi:hypothetical protein